MHFKSSPYVDTLRVFTPARLSVDAKKVTERSDRSAVAMVNCLSGGKHHVREEFYHVSRVRQDRKPPRDYTRQVILDIICLVDRQMGCGVPLLFDYVRILTE